MENPRLLLKKFSHIRLVCCWFFFKGREPFSVLLKLKHRELCSRNHVMFPWSPLKFSNEKCHLVLYQHSCRNLPLPVILVASCGSLHPIEASISHLPDMYKNSFHLGFVCFLTRGSPTSGLQTSTGLGLLGTRPHSRRWAWMYALESSWNHQTPQAPVCGKIVFHETSPGCWKG